MLNILEMFCADSPPEEYDAARFRRADANGDGELSSKEWMTFSAQRCEQLRGRMAKLMPEADADKDGEISDDELVVVKAKIREQALKENPEADKNGDGVLSDKEYEAFRSHKLAERRAKMLERYPEADLDGDGTLSEEEAKALQADRRDRGGEMRKLRRGGMRRTRGKTDE